jgi:hypothetical protein
MDGLMLWQAIVAAIMIGSAAIGIYGYLTSQKSSENN